MPSPADNSTLPPTRPFHDSRALQIFCLSKENHVQDRSFCRVDGFTFITGRKSLENFTWKVMAFVFAEFVTNRSTPESFVGTQTRLFLKLLSMYWPTKN